MMHQLYTSLSEPRRRAELRVDAVIAAERMWRSARAVAERVWNLDGAKAMYGFGKRAAVSAWTKADAWVRGPDSKK